MAKKALALVRKGSKEETTLLALPCDRERAVSEESLFRGKDEVGREGWFLRIEVTGMFPRRCGPFTTQEDAYHFLDCFLNGHVMEGFVDIQNDMDRPSQSCVTEGIPRLVASA